MVMEIDVQAAEGLYSAKHVLYKKKYLNLQKFGRNQNN